MSDQLAEDGGDPTVPRCRRCGAPVARDTFQCPRCGSPLTATPWREDPAATTWAPATWAGQPGSERSERSAGGRPPISRTTALMIGCIGLALALTLAGVLVARGRGPAASPVPTPPRAASTKGAPSTVRTPSGSDTINSLPRSTALPASQFVVPRGGTDDQRLYLADANGPIERELSTPPGHHVNSPTLSSDRQTLVYIDRTEDSLRTIAVDGSHDRRLLDGPADCASITHVTWNPVDQTQLVVRCAGSDGSSLLLVCTLDGEVVRELDPPHLRYDDPALGPDGKTLAYWASDEEGRGGGSLYLLGVDGNGRERRLTRPGADRDADPAWSPDGSQIAFTRRIDAEDSDVYTVPAAGGPAEALVSGPGVDQKPAWSPDGGQLLVVSDRTVDGDAGDDPHLFLVAVAADRMERLEIGARSLSTPVWSRR